MEKIAFLRVFGVHPFLTSLETTLRQNFPEYALETITLAAMLKRRKDLLAKNALHMVKDCGRASGRGWWCRRVECLIIHQKAVV